ncbi:hypothetical protein JOQ06_022322, partial [Pogonophryne albipinna]
MRRKKERMKSLRGEKYPRQRDRGPDSLSPQSESVSSPRVQADPLLKASSSFKVPPSSCLLTASGQEVFAVCLPKPPDPSPPVVSASANRAEESAVCVFEWAGSMALSRKNVLLDTLSCSPFPHSFPSSVSPVAHSGIWTWFQVQNKQHVVRGKIQMAGGYCIRRDSQPVKLALSKRQAREIKGDGVE